MKMIRFIFCNSELIDETPLPFSVKLVVTERLSGVSGVWFEN